MTGNGSASTKDSVHMHSDKARGEMKEKGNTGVGANRRERLTWLTLAPERSAGKFENSFVQTFGPPLVISCAYTAPCLLFAPISMQIASLLRCRVSTFVLRSIEKRFVLTETRLSGELICTDKLTCLQNLKLCCK